MKIACLSGKGGAGKTMIAVNLAAAAKRATYIDCDVEEPNGRLFLKPQEVSGMPVSILLPDFDAEKCSGCRKCVDFCRFHALLYIKEKPMIFGEACHSCGGCMLVCPEKAIREEPKPIGVLETGRHKNIKVVTGILNPGEASGVPVIKEALKQAEGTTIIDCPPGSACSVMESVMIKVVTGILNPGEASGVPVIKEALKQAEGTTIIDCPPGSACSVMESVMDADFCVLVAEPTAFGFHNFQMVYELATLLHKKCGVVINKEETPYEPLMQFCREKQIPVLAEIPYQQELASLISAGELVSERVASVKEQFESLLQKIGGAV